MYIEGERKYWACKMSQYNSTVIRTNMLPGWPWTDSRCVMFLDQKSYPTVFDYDKVCRQLFARIELANRAAELAVPPTSM